MTSVSSARFLLKPLAGALLLASLHAQAYQAGVPNSGTILQQLQPVLPAAPQASRPALEIKTGDAPGLPASAPFQVKAIRIAGNAAFPAGTLHALVADAEGKTLTLPQLEQLAGRITAYYQAHGFPLSRAIVPAQTIADGQVLLQVVEARYGAVRLNNGSQVDEALLSATLAPLQAGQPIAERQLDRALLLLSDVPGVGVDALIKPGAAVGAADLEVAASRRAQTWATLALDNGGNRYIGRARASATLFALNPLRHGDILDAGVVSTGEGMQYGRIGYELLLNGAGTRAGAAYSMVRYKLQDELEALDAHGSAGVATAWIKHPLVRGRGANVYVQFEYDAKRLRDRVGTLDVRTDRRLGNWVLSLNGDARDDLLGGGVSVWSLGWTRGRNRFDDLDAEAADAASAQTRGRYAKWNTNVSRLQGLGSNDALYLNLGAQWANANLDSAEKMTVGGPYTVRAYDIGAVSGDTGYFGSVELRHQFGGGWQATAFADTARVRINRHPWTASANAARLSGAGLGLNWSGPGGWSANLSVATPIGAEPALIGRPSSVRGWITAAKAF